MNRSQNNSNDLKDDLTHQEQNIEDERTSLDDLQLKINELNSKLEASNLKISEQNDKILRTLAELENFRKRANEDISKARKFGIESFAKSLLPIKDSIEAALSNCNNDIPIVKEGLEVTLKQITSSFERNFLKEIIANVGDKFDPHIHQAMSSIPSEQPNNSIVELLQKGYMIHDRIIRPALVIVSSGLDK